MSQNARTSTPYRALNTEACIQILLAHGISPTRQRIKIAETLLTRPQHLAAEQVLEQVNQERVHVSKATVYNTLGLFARKGLVKEVVVDSSKVFYDSNTVPHHHFYNEETGEITDIDAGQLSITALPELPQGTTVSGVEVIIRIRKQPNVSS